MPREEQSVAVGASAVVSLSDGVRSVGDVPVGGQFANHDEYRPTASNALEGTSMRLVAEGSGAIDVRFVDGEMIWRQAEGSAGAERARYEALEVRGGVVVVVSRRSDGVSLLAVLDRARRRALVVQSELVDAGEAGVREHTSFLQAGIGQALSDPFTASDDLVGKRVLWRYSSTHAIEHIYLSSAWYCWHCVAGPERLLADVDRCATLRIAEKLYLFSWSEGVVPFNGALVIDVEGLESVGRLFGWDTALRRADQIVVGAHGTLLNETGYES